MPLTGTKINKYIDVTVTGMKTFVKKKISRDAGKFP